MSTSVRTGAATLFARGSLRQAACIVERCFNTHVKKICCVESSLASAPLLEQQSASISLLKYSSGAQLFVIGLPLFLIDENASLVGTFQLWLDKLAGMLGSRGDSHLPSLLISGHVKVCRTSREAELAGTTLCWLIAEILVFRYPRQGNCLH